MTRAPRDNGFPAGRRRTARLIHENGLKARPERRFKVPDRGSVNPPPLGDRDAILPECRIIKQGSHTIWDGKYHLVWVTKYRYPVLVGDAGQRARELLREIARSNEMTIYAGAVNRDHVHKLISIPPQLSVSRAVQLLKGKSSHKLLPEYQAHRKRYWGQHLWARGYWVASSGTFGELRSHR